MRTLILLFALLITGSASAVGLHESVTWAGFEIPNYFGIIFYFIGLAYGASLSVHQETAVDKYIKSPKLKPFYSFGFGLFITAFGIPLKFPDITIWELILPAVLCAAIGSQVIYYFISSAKEVMIAVTKKLTGVDMKDKITEVDK